MAIFIPPQLINPLGIDAVIQRIQTVLNNNISWLSTIYGRTFENKNSETNLDELLVKTERNDYESILPNDNETAFCYFITKSYNKSTNSIYSVNLSLVFWLNLNKTTIKDIHELGLQVWKLIDEQCKIVEIESFVFNDKRVIFREVNIDDNEYYNIFPFGAFRIELLARVSLPC